MRGQYFSFDILTAVFIFLIVSSIFIVFFLFNPSQSTVKEELRTQVALEISNSLLSPGEYSLYSPDGSPRPLSHALLSALSQHYSRLYSRKVSIAVEPAGFYGCPPLSLSSPRDASKVERISTVSYPRNLCYCPEGGCTGVVEVPALISVYVS